MLRDMEEEGVFPGVFTFSILVNAFCKKRCVKDTELAVQAMLRRGLELNITTYNTLIDGHGYCLRGELNEVKKVPNVMIVKDLVSDIITYNSLINRYCKKKRVQGIFFEISQIRVWFQMFSLTIVCCKVCFNHGTFHR